MQLLLRAILGKHMSEGDMIRLSDVLNLYRIIAYPSASDLTVADFWDAGTVPEGHNAYISHIITANSSWCRASGNMNQHHGYDHLPRTVLHIISRHVCWSKRMYLCSHVYLLACHYHRTWTIQRLKYLTWHLESRRDRTTKGTNWSTTSKRKPWERDLILKLWSLSNMSSVQKVSH